MILSRWLVATVAWPDIDAAAFLTELLTQLGARDFKVWRTSQGAEAICLSEGKA